MSDAQSQLASCPRCGAKPKDDGTLRVNYEVFECGTELFEGKLTGPCTEPEQRDKCGHVSPDAGYVCTLDTGHDGYHENGHGIVWMPEPCSDPGCVAGKQLLYDALIHAKRQRDRAIHRAQQVEPGWHPDHEGPYT